MTTEAGSFAGRVLAVFSRRSPGFHPPRAVSTPPTPKAATSKATPTPTVTALDASVSAPSQIFTPAYAPGQQLIQATNLWRFMPPPVRLQFRSSLESLSTPLHSTRESTNSDYQRLIEAEERRERAASLRGEIARQELQYLSSNADSDRILLNHLKFELEDLSATRAANLTMEEVHDKAREILTLADGLNDLLLLTEDDSSLTDIFSMMSFISMAAHELSASETHEEAYELASTLLASMREIQHIGQLRLTRRTRKVIGQVSAYARYLCIQLNSSRVRSRDLTLSMIVEVARSLKLALNGNHTSMNSTVEHAWNLAAATKIPIEKGSESLAFTRNLLLELDTALINTQGAAKEFLGADLSNVDLRSADLVGILWDSATLWPTPEWAEIIRVASQEIHPGSGIFVVVVHPEESRAFSNNLS